MAAKTLSFIFEFENLRDTYEVDSDYPIWIKQAESTF